VTRRRRWTHVSGKKAMTRRQLTPDVIICSQ